MIFLFFAADYSPQRRKEKSGIDEKKSQILFSVRVSFRLPRRDTAATLQSPYGPIRQIDDNRSIIFSSTRAITPSCRRDADRNSPSTMVGEVSFVSEATYLDSAIIGLDYLE